MPEHSLLAVVEDAPQAAVKPGAPYTPVNDAAHGPIAHLTKENKRVIPDEDVRVVARGFVAARLRCGLSQRALSG